MMGSPRSGEKVIIGIAVILCLVLVTLGITAVSITEPQVEDFPQEGAEAIVFEAATPLEREPVLPSAISGVERLAAQPGEPLGTPLTLHLVNGETGELIPNHEVWFKRGFPSGEAGLEAAFIETGELLRTDAEGSLQVAFSYGFLNFFAREDHLVGRFFVSGSEMKKEGRTEMTLELLPERGISIRVLSSEGVAIPGVLISQTLLTAVPALQFWNSRSGVTASSTWSGAAIGLTPEPDGVLPWPDLGLLVQQRERSGGRIETLRLSAHIPGLPALYRDFSPIPNHGSSVDLQLPTTGELTLRVLDALGQEFPGVNTVSLKPLELDETTGEWKANQNNWVGNNTKNGVVHFPAVALGVMFWATPSGFVKSTPWEIKGPTMSNPRVTHEVRLGNELVLFRGRALDSERRPLADEHIWFRATRAGENRSGQTHRFTGHATTDSEGRFGALLPAEVTQVDLAEAAVTCDRLVLDLMHHAPFSTGVHEFRDLVFREVLLPLILSGTVFPAADAPCKNFSLKIEHRADPGLEWKDSGLRSQIDESTFSVRGEPQRGEYRLQVIPAARCHILPEPVEFTPGLEGLEVHLERGHTLAISTRVPLSSEYDWRIAPLKTLLRPTAGPAMQRIPSDAKDGIRMSNSARKEGDDVELYWNGLVEGIYQLELRMNADEQILEIIPGIRVPARNGELARAELDLSPYLKAITLNLIGEFGQLGAKGVSVQQFYEGLRTGYARWSPKNPYVRVVLGKSDIWIRAAGYDPRLLRNPTQDMDVLLTPSGAEILVSTSAGATVPDGAALRIGFKATAAVPFGWEIPGDRNSENGDLFALNLRGMNRTWPSEVTAMLDASLQARVRLHRRGLQVISIELVPKSQDLRKRWGKDKLPIDSFSPKTYDLEASTAPQSIQLHIPQSAIDEALRKIDAK